MSMSFSWKNLFGLPPAVASLVLTEWLSVQHIGLLDSACCNRTVRESFLDACQQKQNSFTAKDVRHANRLFAWVILRMFHISDCCCSNEIDLALLASLLTTTGTTLRRLSVHGISESQLLSAAEIIAITSQVALKCANLSMINFENCIIPCISDIINKNCSLVELNIQSCKMFGYFPVDYNSCFTLQLRTLALHECEFTESSAIYFGNLAERAHKFGMSAEGSSPHHMSLIGQLANLRELYLFNVDIQDEDLCAVVARCSLIVRLYIPKCRELTDQSVIFAVQHLQLQVIDVGTISLTNEFLHAAGEHGFALETLLFERTETFSVDAIAAVVQKCTKLNRIGTGWIGADTAQFSAIVAPTFTNITTLILVGDLRCKEILVAVAKHCRKLEQLDLSDDALGTTSSVDIHGIAPVLNLCLQLRVLVLTERDMGLYFSSGALTILAYLRPKLQLSTDWTQCQP